MRILYFAQARLAVGLAEETFHPDDEVALLPPVSGG